MFRKYMILLLTIWSVSAIAEAQVRYASKPISEFNTLRHPRTWGFSVGYVEKDWVIDGEALIPSHRGPLSDDPNNDYVSGIQAGIRFCPQWKYGFGAQTGIYYQFFYDADDGPKGVTYSFNEHSLYVPLHLEYRLNFGRDFQLMAYGGLGVDFGLNGCYKSRLLQDDGEELVTTTVDNVYDKKELEMNRLNISKEFGIGISVGCVLLQFQTSKGLIDMAQKGASYTVYQDKPMTVSLSLMF